MIGMENISEQYNSRIGCIIKTDYKNRYHSVLEKYKEIRSKSITGKDIENFQMSDDFSKYFNDLSCGELTLDFSLNQNFYKDIKEEKGRLSQVVPIGGFSLSPTERLEDKAHDFNLTDTFRVKTSEQDNDINLLASTAQTLSYYYPDRKIVGKEIYRLKTEGNNANGSVLGAIKRKVSATNSNRSYISQGLAKKIFALQTRTIGYLVPHNTAGFSDCLSEANSQGLLVWDRNLNVYRLISKTLKLFTNLFSIIEYTLVVIRIVLLIIVGNENIKKNKYQIGIRKSIGRKDKDIRTIFRAKSIVFEAGSVILALLLLPLFFLLANKLLVQAYSSFMSMSIENRTVFYFHPFIILFDILGVCLFFLVVALIPFIKLKKIMPAKIVNNKDE